MSDHVGPGSNSSRGTPWARHLILTVPLFTQVYKWVPANLLLGVTMRWTSIPSSGSDVPLSTQGGKKRGQREGLK